MWTCFGLFDQGQDQFAAHSFNFQRAADLHVMGTHEVGRQNQAGAVAEFFDG